MRKFLLLFTALALLLGVSACTGGQGPSALSFEYNFNIDGHATGDVDVTFPGGELTLKGDAGLGFRVDSPSFSAPATKASPGQFRLATIDELQASGKKDCRYVADVFLSDYDAAFTASSADGTYYLHITGSVREKLTGIEVKIDKVLTNEEGPDYKSE